MSDSETAILGTVASLIVPSSELAANRAFWVTALGVQPYFDQPFYVGFQQQGFEVGLDPDAAAEGAAAPMLYWEVADLAVAVAALQEAGAPTVSEIREVGEDLLMATVSDPCGNRFGVLQHR